MVWFLIISHTFKSVVRPLEWSGAPNPGHLLVQYSLFSPITLISYLPQLKLCNFGFVHKIFWLYSYNLTFFNVALKRHVQVTCCEHLKQRRLNMFHTMSEQHPDTHQCCNPSSPWDTCSVNLGKVTECSPHQTQQSFPALSIKNRHTQTPSSNRNEPLLWCQCYTNLTQPSSSTCNEPAVRSTITKAQKPIV